MKGALVLLAMTLGYVMPGYSIVRRVADKRDDLSLTTVKVDGTAQVGTALAAELGNVLGVQGSDLSLTMAVSMRVPGRCRLDLGSTSSTRQVSAITNNGKKRNEGGEIAAMQVLIDHLCPLLATRGGGDGETRAGYDRYLQSIKVDARKVSLGRFSNGVAYVLGDSQTANANQFWVYKDGLQPARVKVTDDKGTAWDLRLIDFRSQSSGDAFPRVVELHKGDQLVLRLTSLEVDLKPKLDDNRF